MNTVRTSAAALAAACLITSAAAIVATAPTVSAQYKLDESSVVRISLADLKKRMAEGRVVVVDVRDAASYAQGHIPGSWLIPVETTAQRTAELKKLGKMVVTYCS
ncbi:MAG: hypothetical protein JNM38_06245 [Acidobacteria bacterium]|jgi:3-mercaptopyruvate sulfurtransferase SseA|nr:hypothetical protein [Acidobacteriota bacterium]